MKKLKARLQFKQLLSQLKEYRRGWETQLVIFTKHPEDGAQEILFSLYEISSMVICALEDMLEDKHSEPQALQLVKRKLERLIISKTFQDYDLLGLEELSFVVSKATKHPIRILLQTLDALT